MWLPCMQVFFLFSVQTLFTPVMSLSCTLWPRVEVGHGGFALCAGVPPASAFLVSLLRLSAFSPPPSHD